MFRPHQNLSDEINRNIIQSEVEGGVYLRDLPEAAKVEVQTRNRYYTIITRRDGSAWIWGHPEFCPDPVEVRIHGSTWGGSMLRTKFLGRGMHLEFEHPVHKTIVTSRILDIQQGEEAGDERQYRRRDDQRANQEKQAVLLRILGAEHRAAGVQRPDDGCDGGPAGGELQRL